LQHVAACCSVLQRVVRGANIRIKESPVFAFRKVSVCCSVWQCVAASCSELQCVAVCCRELQRVLRGSEGHMKVHRAVCSSKVQRVAVCCSMLQCIAVCCSVFYDVPKSV